MSASTAKRDVVTPHAAETGPGSRGSFRSHSSRSSSLPGNPRAAAASRQFVRAVLADWTAQGLPGAAGISDRLTDDAVLLISELVTNAVVHAGTAVELLCRLEEDDRLGDGPDHGLPARAPAALVVEVSDHHPARALRRRHRTPGSAPASSDGGYGLQLVGALAESWGITYGRGLKTVWFRMPLAESGGPGGSAAGHGESLRRELRAAEILAPAPLRSAARSSEPDWSNHGALSFLAEASDLLAGQLDVGRVASLATQLVVPRLADWCAVWLRDDADDSLRLSRVWHSNENRIEGLRAVLEKEPPAAVPLSDHGRRTAAGRGTAIPSPWPEDGVPYGNGGAALACPLVAGGRWQGTLLLGRAGLMGFPDQVVSLIEDLTGRVARAVSTARVYGRQERISRVLQRGLLPSGLARIPGMDTALVYEPSDGAWAGGDFYDLFPAGDGRWCFALGDVCGSGPEAAAVTGLARPVLRLLAREGYSVTDVLDRLNRTLAQEAADSAAVAAAAVAAAAAGQGIEPEGQGDTDQTRFLSLLYGEIVPYPSGRGARCTVVSAGHPLPLVLHPDGSVRVAAAPQVLVGVVDDAVYESESFDLSPGETLLCVTDGVTERRSGRRQFDDGDGLAAALGACMGLGAAGVAEHIRRAVHSFGEDPPEDDLALLVLQAL
ncbi:SpoIIE family protein phosphatase [Streptomyces sp. H27-D2]|uniref:SpoIIE family protein phosphatase n=1 Tax=Streptomyces sp. H27-D2 TaxID=3046304 RepID=UPI002DB74380|nr:SpoIIE family protein phosphatase [Streptomyces sp. H27-D2]MEC4014801.1 SpoIIE family protein phosphatase [Streptomyces sp. H27-D2]